MAQKMAKPSHAIKGIYALTPDSIHTEALLASARLVCVAGINVLQYRNKVADAPLRLAQALALREVTTEYGVIFIVNDDAQLAASVSADGVHLGATDGSVEHARVLLGKDKLIGVSCYNQLQLARDAVQAGADYVAFGAFYSSTVKPNAAVATIELLRDAHAELPVPIVVIGGIDASNGANLVAAGANALAVISAIFDAVDIQLAVKNLNKLFK